MKEKIIEKEEKEKEERTVRLIEMELLKREAEKIEQELNELEQRKLELEVVKISIHELKNKEDREILVPLGGGIFANAKMIKSNDFLVNVGSNVVLKKDVESMIKLIDEQISNIEIAQKSIEDEFVGLANQMQAIQST